MPVLWGKSETWLHIAFLSRDAPHWEHICHDLGVWASCSCHSWSQITQTTAISQNALVENYLDSSRGRWGI